MFENKMQIYMKTTTKKQLFFFFLTLEVIQVLPEGWCIQGSVSATVLIQHLDDVQQNWDELEWGPVDDPQKNVYQDISRWFTKRTWIEIIIHYQ